jgi:protein-tyrosine-phosphatase
VVPLVRGATAGDIRVAIEAPVYTDFVVVLFVCTANVCRSPMAAAHLGVVVGDLDEPVTVASAGLLEGGHPVTREVLLAMAPFGVDLTTHRSTSLTPAAVQSADLVLGMERRHAREAILLVPAAWNRTFTLKEFVRRGETSGARRPAEPLSTWLVALTGSRERTDLIGRSPEDDVADPLGGSLADYRATAAELADLVQRMAKLLWSDAGRADS